jgi:SAM-dependent methyltransferase
LKAAVKKILPRPIKTVLRRAYDSLAGNDHHVACAVAQNENVLSGELLPSRELQDYVGGGFVEVGAEFLRHFVELCDLKPHESVLDVGCGSGRMALPLTGYLNERARYEGFDLFEDAVKWCSENITAKFPHFKFQTAELHNSAYRTNTERQASEFRFPYGDEEFDFVFLTSVFTHMLPADMEHYFEELARVIKPGGRCLITLFLLNDESTVLIDNFKGEYNFEHRCEGYRTINKERPEDALAYPEDFIRSRCEKYGFKVREPIRYGNWCGRTNHLSFQDIMIVDK